MPPETATTPIAEPSVPAQTEQIAAPTAQDRLQAALKSEKDQIDRIVRKRGKGTNGTTPGQQPDAGRQAVEESRSVTPEQAPKPENAAASTTEHDSVIVGRAMMLGFTEQDARAEEPRVLAKLVEHGEKIQQSLKAQFEKNGQTETPAPETRKGKLALDEFKPRSRKERMAQDAQREQARKRPALDDLDDLDDDDDELDPISSIADLGQRAAADMTALQRRLESLERQLSSQRTNSFDSWIASMGNDHAGVLGSGATASLNPFQSQKLNRDKIQVEADVMRAGYEAKGLQVPGDEALWSRAFRALFDAEVQAAARRNHERQIADRESQHIAPPTRREEAPVTDEIELIRKRARELAKERKR